MKCYGLSTGAIASASREPCHKAGLQAHYRFREIALWELNCHKKMPVCETGIFKHPLPPQSLRGNFISFPPLLIHNRYYEYQVGSIRK